MTEPVWILFTAFRRTQVAVRTIAALKEHLHYPNLHWHICDDGSKITDDGTERNHIKVLKEAIDDEVTAHDMGTPWGEFDLGGNINRGIQIAQDHGCSQYFLVGDDYILLDDLDLTPYVATLKENPQVGFVRFVLLVPGMAGLVTGYRGGNQVIPFLRLIREWCLRNPWKIDSYVHAIFPALIHQRFYDAYGYYPEHMTPGNTETGMCSQYNDSSLGEDGPQILWPIPLWPMQVRWGHPKKRSDIYRNFAGENGKDGLDVWGAI